MSTLKRPPATSSKVTVKVAAPVAAKKVARKVLTTKPAATPVKPAQALVKAAPAPKKITKTTAKRVMKPTVKVSPAKEVKVEKVKKPKLIRDSFTIPKAEYLVIEALKERAGKLSRSAKKSELLRAGIKALAAMSDAAFLSALTVVPTIKTGRPSNAS
jgi:hypothetical protein